MRTVPLLCCTALTLGALTQFACSRVHALTPTGATLASLDSDAQLRPRLRERAYVSADGTTADVYLSDLSDQELDALLAEDNSLASTTGQLIHIHMFLEPRPGRTPIEPTAANASVRYAVLAGGEMGVYTGAGFLMPASSPGDSVFAGDLVQSTLRLNRATDRFRDLLGAADLRASFSASKRPADAGRIAAAIDLVAQQTARVAPPESLEP